MKELKAFIYCRVLDEKARSLLDYQEKKLTELSQYLDMKVIACAKEVGSWKYFGTFAIQKLIHHIVVGKIDVVLVYDETRLAIYDDFYAEFQMICDQHDVDILTINDLKSMIFANSILTCHD